MGPRPRLALALLWLALLVLGGWAIGQRLALSGDLRKFMPDARTPAQKLLIDELGEGPGSRLLLVALSGADPATLATQSQALVETLGSDAAFSLVGNGASSGLEAIPEHLRPYRYLLSPALDAEAGSVAAPAFGEAQLREALDARLQDLGSPAAAMLEPLLPSDPTLELLRVAEALQPALSPRQLHGVWFDRAGKRALLVVQTHAAGFDPTGQATAVQAIEAAFARISKGSGSALDMTGPGAFSVEIGGRTQREASWIGMVDTIGLIALLWIAYGSWRAPLFGVLPLASAGLAGLGAVALLFDGVHGITVAFGFTLIGVVQDYPIHLLSHQRPGWSPWQNARALWPTLATGVVATCIAYVTFLFSGVEGLEQLAVFTIAGLAVAALATRLVLPGLIDPAPRDRAASARLATLWRRIDALPRPRASLLVVALLGLAAIAFAPGAAWQNDLSKLTPVPADALARDAVLRSELGAPDVRYMLALHGPSTEDVLRASERLRPQLDRLVAEGAMQGYDLAARYLPSAATQRARQARLPAPDALRAALDGAVAGTPFRSDAFEPFVADVEAARRAPPLTTVDLAGTPLATSVDGLLLTDAAGATALVSLAGLAQPDAVARVARANGAELLDLKEASESLVAMYRGRVLAALAVAALLLALTVAIALRAPGRVARVLLPMALTTIVVVAVLRLAGVELTLFHLVALILAAGLGLDYALFFDHAGDDYADQLRTLHALVVCSLMTVLVFFLLALSSIPVLRAIGTTVTLGVACNFVLALLVSRQPSSRASRDAAAAGHSSRQAVAAGGAG